MAEKRAFPELVEENWERTEGRRNSRRILVLILKGRVEKGQGGVRKEKSCRGIFPNPFFHNSRQGGLIRLPDCEYEIS